MLGVAVPATGLHRDPVHHMGGPQRTPCWRTRMELLDLHIICATRVARRLGHAMSDFQPGSRCREYIATCGRCGALTIVNDHPPHGGTYGTACVHRCDVRRIIRAMPGEDTDECVCQ